MAAIADAFNRIDRTIQWSQPRRSFLCGAPLHRSKAEVNEALNKPLIGGAANFKDLEKIFAKAEVEVERKSLMAYGLRRGAAYDFSRISDDLLQRSGYANDIVAFLLSHSGDTHSGHGTQIYAGFGRATFWAERLNTNSVHDLTAI